MEGRPRAHTRNCPDIRDANPYEQEGRTARTANAGQDCGRPQDGAILWAFILSTPLSDGRQTARFSFPDHLLIRGNQLRKLLASLEETIRRVLFHFG